MVTLAGCALRIPSFLDSRCDPSQSRCILVRMQYPDLQFLSVVRSELMSAALKPSGARASSAPQPQPATRTAQLRPIRPPGDRHLHSVAEAPARSRPTHLLSLLNQAISVVSGALVMTVLGSYSYTVYLDRQLDHSTARLNLLQRSQQQLTTVNEVLKDHMAEAAEQPSTGLQPPQPTNVIFLKPAQRRTAPLPAAPSPAPAAKPATAPLGY